MSEGGLWDVLGKLADNNVVESFGRDLTRGYNHIGMRNPMDCGPSYMASYATCPAEVFVKTSPAPLIALIDAICVGMARSFDWCIGSLCEGGTVKHRKSITMSSSGR